MKSDRFKIRNWARDSSKVLKDLEKAINKKPKRKIKKKTTNE